MITNPYNPVTEPVSHQWFEEVKRPTLEESNKLKAIKKTATISLVDVKDSDGWAQLGFALGFDYDRISKIFRWGEYGSVDLVIDEDLNIVGGRVIS